VLSDSLIGALSEIDSGYSCLYSLLIRILEGENGQVPRVGMRTTDEGVRKLLKPRLEGYE